MGSYCSLDIDDLNVHSFKSEVPDFLISLFQESDRRCVRSSTRPDPGDEPDEDIESIGYVASRAVVLDRLDVLGITADAAHRAFEAWRSREIESKLEWEEEGVDWFQSEKDTLQTLSYELWCKRVPTVLRARSSGWNTPPEPFIDGIDRKMRDHDEGWLFFPTTDRRINIRAILDACSNATQVSLDITDLINDGYFGIAARICDEARAAGAIKRSALEPAIIIGEGSSDISILRDALAALFPDVRDYFGFFDYEELRVDGGASYVTKFLRAFGGARISSRVVAVFDNDTAGRDQFDVATCLPLPTNIQVMHLPDIDIARAYPSIGPQGVHEVDVNGKAASIELYLGKQNLIRSDGKLTPVRWRSYNDRTRSYQGEIENKSEVVERFNRDLTQIQRPEEARARFPELAAIWQAIFGILK
jgi:hypothetical protein